MKIAYAAALIAGFAAPVIAAEDAVGLAIDVTTEKRYTQAGCARLKVKFWQDGVLLPGASNPRRQTIDFGINYCLDGQPPRSLK